MSSLPSWCPEYSPLKINPVTGLEVYCICKKPDEGELMVGCDGCDDWFHFKCLKMPNKYRRLVAAFYCPYCQAGITGKDKDDASKPLPKTLWKRKCRVEECYEPCAEHSKYCSEEHGLQYMRNVVNKSTVDDNEKSAEVVRKMLFVSEGNNGIFQSIGKEKFIDDNIPTDVDPVLYKKIIEQDSGLSQLTHSQDKCINVTMKGIQERITTLDKYIDWVEDINTKLNASQDDENGNNDDESVNHAKKLSSKKRKRKGNNKKAVARKTICGYSSDLSIIPCTSEEFMQLYRDGSSSETQTEIKGICSKLKCNRHHDWMSIDSDQLQQDMETAEANNDRLSTLIKMRKRQLHCQFYEQLISAHLQVEPTPS
ncbi:similar to Saccharomyces cerevisiae YPL138C SPP1 Subunit of COMPASS (Set1C), a complex which methylates histone H3 on lysine 4 and is required in telomeric transcriptional silencing [Maudiozyma barnettii]|uniref:Similar to Saccharomyces cerevisiae YPL138C SPP1 Subunit of COMPASS (Set1C), a complex which methylates histone H3 on lysine 4 and is required in telomeric transcriptional silencing n=1 Tax=Maudiozyma barnettii TaxID=61262 RepID=A0A8H2ZFU7_9SACH|nr:Spp1p [Kazachstania barnettii]CAB4252730.1 similar to Saccharomyces cerevisiae YPL138C SPP1 Subunit of COMPASS (Set1C), a complex which methylates histone H3 on lysine 4 and is required in telomeric transcriptional silencing [Kazachstania barnettii]CAD1780520.1 similar to Saccharomyces cerevisiae YPL138C SPP1 Subunit of COMPASS (Set1C), a complex which methylates histone H3 on lysine 4 and is required in telomeric transcriptional silencing [Kazachstania barnettii]